MLDKLLVPPRADQSAIASFHQAGGSERHRFEGENRLWERQGLEVVQISAWPDTTTETMEAVAEIVGLIPPPANRFNEDGDRMLMWVGPRRWYLVAQEGREFEAKLRDVLGAETASITMLGAGLTTFRLSGSRIPAILLKGMSVDLDVDAFPTGACIATALHRIPVKLYRIDNAPTFDVVVSRGLALSLWDLLRETGLEYNLRTFAPERVSL